jgi:hypothetical protein
LKTGWNAGARSARDVAPSAPRKCRALGPHRLPSVRRHSVDHTSVIVPRPTASRPHARYRWSGCAVRPPSRWPRAAQHAGGPVGQATWRASAPVGPPNTPCTPPPSHSLRRSSEPPLRARRRRRSELAGAPHCRPPLLELEHHISLHPQTLDPPVHMHWLANPPACWHCGRSSRPPPSLAADCRRSSFRPNRPHQSTEGESKPHHSHSLTGVRPFLAAGQPCSATRDLLARIEIFPGA